MVKIAIVVAFTCYVVGYLIWNSYLANTVSQVRVWRRTPRELATPQIRRRRQQIRPADLPIILRRELGADQVKVLRHATSGDVTGDYSSVVGYGAAVILKGR